MEEKIREHLFSSEFFVDELYRSFKFLVFIFSVVFSILDETFV